MALARELASRVERASWAVLLLDDNFCEVACVCGPVWYPTMQTPQAGEQAAFQAIMQIAKGPCLTFGDCATVVTQSGQSTRTLLNPKRMYANSRARAMYGGIPR